MNLTEQYKAAKERMYPSSTTRLIHIYEHATCNHIDLLLWQVVWVLLKRQPQSGE